jgi:hypothetical protein
MRKPDLGEPVLAPIERPRLCAGSMERFHSEARVDERVAEAGERNANQGQRAQSSGADTHSRREQQPAFQL